MSDSLELEPDDSDLPSEEKIERMEERLETVQGEQKNLFLIIFQVCSLRLLTKSFTDISEYLIFFFTSDRLTRQAIMIHL